MHDHRLFFKIYLEKKFKETGKTRSELYNALELNRSTFSNYLKDKRKPLHWIIKATVKFFSNRKSDRKNDLYLIYFGE